MYTEQLDVPNIKIRGAMEINILSVWPERARQFAEIETMFDSQMDRAKQEDIQRQKLQENRENIIILCGLLTSREIGFWTSVVKKYFKLKTIFLK